MVHRVQCVCGHQEVVDDRKETMAEVTLEQIENREDELAVEEYNIRFADLPPDIKQNVHNAALHELGLKRVFKFVCITCGKEFEEDVEGDLIIIYTEIQSEIHSEILQGNCKECRVKHDSTETRW